MSLPHVTIATAVRDGSPLLDAFYTRTELLVWPHDLIRLVVCEGDSVDDTWGRLTAWATYDKRLRLVRHDTGMPRFGSVVNAERFRTLARVFNAALSQVDLEWSDYVLFVPFDIQFGPHLLANLVARQVDAICPLTWQPTAHGMVFYDTWALTWHGGQHWQNWPPEHVQTLVDHRPVEMETIGGTVLWHADILRAGCRYGETDVDQGLSKAARRAGFKLWADPLVHVIHPMPS